MKNLFSLAKTAVICFLIYKSLFYSFLFLVSGLWIITVLLLILFAYLCKSLIAEAISLRKFYKNYQHTNLREKFSKVNFKTKTSKRFSSETV